MLMMDDDDDDVKLPMSNEATQKALKTCQTKSSLNDDDDDDFVFDVSFQQYFSYIKMDV